MQNFPPQLLSYKEKAASNFKWARDCMDVLLSSSSHSIVDYEEMLSNYQLYNNILNQNDFERECNPLGLDVGQYRDSIQPYNKTYNKIQVLLGEEIKRPFNYKAILVNSDGIRSKLEYKNQLLKEYIMSFIQGNQPNSIPPEEIDRHMSLTYLEAREITANKILQYLSKKLNLKDLRNDAFKHALLSAREIVYVDENNDEPIVEIVNPLTFFYQAHSDNKFIQKSLFAGRKVYMPVSEVFDKYKDYMKSEDISRLDDRTNHLYGTYTSYNPANFPMPNSHPNEVLNNDKDFIKVEHVEWVSQRKVGFLSFVNQYGELQKEIVSEEFSFPKHTKATVNKEYGKKVTYYYYTDPVTNVTYTLEWTFIPEVWQGTRIDGDIYCMIGPKRHQFRSSDNPYEVKLGYHGTIYNNTNAKPISVMQRMKPFQYLYFIIMHKLKKLIAQDAGPILKIDKSMLDPTLGWEKTLYFIKEAGIEFYNSLENAESAGASHRGIVTDAPNISTTPQVLNYISLLAAIDQQISDVAGVTRQREGQVDPTEAVSNAQSAVMLSSTLTEIYFNQHNLLWQEILTSMLDITVDLWKDKGMTKQYVLDDLSTAILEITPSDLTSMECSIFVSNTMKEEEIFTAIKFLGDRLLQLKNGRFSDLIKLYKSSSVEELDSVITSAEKRFDEMEQQRFEQELQANQALETSKQEFELLKLDMQHAHEIDVAEIETFKFLKDQDINNNQVPDQLEIEKFKVDTELKKRKLDLEERKLKIMARNKKRPE